MRERQHLAGKWAARMAALPSNREIRTGKHRLLCTAPYDLASRSRRNAAIQAASAGDAGRGFTVVAEEVQRLAERSAEATKQIAAIVKTIQTDTQDAVAAMERSTRGVVEGAQLSDNAGTALTEIDRVSRQLAELIEAISQAASKEAQSANVVAANIQHIFAVTEQTGAGTRATAEQVRELNRMAEELRQSVSRFKIA